MIASGDFEGGGGDTSTLLANLLRTQTAAPAPAPAPAPAAAPSYSDYLSSLKLNGSGMAEQPNAQWSITDPGSLDYYGKLYNQLGGAGSGVVDWSKLGYTGPGVSLTPGERDSGGDYIQPTNRFDVPDAWKQFVDSNGYGLAQGVNDQNFQLSQLMQNGKPIAGASYSESMPNQDMFNLVRAVVNTGLVAGAGYAAAGAGGGAGTGAAATTGGTSAGLSSADLAALYGNAGYGAGSAAEAGFAGLGGTTAGGAAGLSAAELAALPGAYASAPAYGGVGSSLASGAGGGTSAGSGSMWDTLLSKAGDFATNPKTYTDLLKAYAGGSGGGGAAVNVQGGGFRAPDRSAQIQAEALRKQNAMAQQSYKPTWSGGQ